MSEARKRKNRRLKQAKEEVRKCPFFISSDFCEMLSRDMDQNTCKLWSATYFKIPKSRLSISLNKAETFSILGPN